MDGYGRGADREPRDSYRDRDGKVSERDRRRDYHDNDNNDNDYRRRRRDGGDGDRRRRDDYDDGRRRGDDGRDGRRTDDDDRSRREDYRDRDRDRGDHPPRDGRDRRERDGERGGSPRRSASPRRSRPHSRSRSLSASAPPAEDKAKPNFAPSGLLAAATNTVKNADGTSTLLKYNEPPEARKPLVGWRLYVFKGDEQLGALHLILYSVVHASNRIHSTCRVSFMQSCSIYIVRARTSSVVTARSQTYPSNIRRAPSSML